MPFISIRHKKEGKIKKITEVEATRVDRQEHERKNKIPHSRSPKKVTSENQETPNEDIVEISPNEVITPRKNNKQDK